MDTTSRSAYWYSAGFCWQAMAAWAAALAVGLLFTTVEWFSGPLATTWIGRNGLGWAATILAAAGCTRCCRARPPAGTAAAPPASDGRSVAMPVPVRRGTDPGPSRPVRDSTLPRSGEWPDRGSVLLRGEGSGD